MTAGRSLIIALLGVLAPATAVGAPPRAGVLPIAGPAEPAAQLTRELVRALATEPVVAPDRLARRLSGDREVLRSLLAVRGALEQAERDTLYMRRGPAVQAAQRAIDSLDTVAGRLHAPALAARAQATLALALLLSPADEPGATLAFRQAVSIDPSYQPDPDRTPSRARRLFEQARRSASAPTAPGPEELAIVAGLTALERLFWVGLGPDGQVELVVYDQSHRRVERRERVVSAPRALAARLRSYLSVAKAPPPAPAASQPFAADRVPKASRPGASPWYRRWWIWAIAGAVVVGAGVTVAVVASAPGERSYQFNVSY